MSTPTWNRLLLIGFAFIVASLINLDQSRAGGGRGCICMDLLQNLDAKHVPARLMPAQAMPEIIAAFDIGERAVTALDFLGDGETLVVAESGPERRGEGAAGRVLLFDLTGKEPHPAGRLDATADEVDALAVAPMTGHWLATGSVRWNQQLKLWRYSDTGTKLVQTIPDLSNWWIRTMAFSHDEHTLATVSGDAAGPVQLWDVTDQGLQKRSVLPGPAWAASAIAFSPEGPYLAAGLGSGHHHPNDGQLLIWDLSDEPSLVQQSFISGKSENHPPSDVMALKWIGNRHTLVTGDQSGTLQFHHLTDDRLERIAQASAHARGVRSIVAIADDRVLSSGNDGVVVLWSASGERQREWRFGNEPAVLAVAPSRTHVAVGLANGTVYILKLE